MLLALLLGSLVGLALAAAASAAAAALVDAEVAAGTTFAPWDVAISRRPYITEETGELLLQLDPATVVGGQLEVTAIDFKSGHRCGVQRISRPWAREVLDARSAGGVKPDAPSPARGRGQPSETTPVRSRSFESERNAVRARLRVTQLNGLADLR